MNFKGKIAFITPPFMGHLNPTLGVGKTLIDIGYDVCWISMLDYSKSIPQKGRFYHLPTVTPNYENNSENNHGMGSVHKLYKSDLLPLNEFMFEPIREVFHKENFDFIVVDHQAFVGAILAYHLNIPFATSVTAPAAIDSSEHFPEVNNYEQSMIISLQKRFGIELEYPLVCNSDLTLVYTSKYFIQNDNFPDSYKFIGPSVNERKEYTLNDEHKKLLEADKPKILITLGSILSREELFIDKVIDAFKDEDIIICLVADPNIKEQWPGNFHVYSFIPQIEILKKVQLVICHAGHNTVSEALYMGVPLITMPMVNDQSYVATKVKNIGAGLRLKYRRLKAEHLKTAAFEILNNSDYKNAALKVKKSFEDAGGEKQAAHLIHKVIQKKLVKNQNPITV